MELEENRVIRPPRQSWHRKAPGANRFNRHNRHDRHRRETWRKRRRERGGNKRRKVYREVSFNNQIQRQIEL